MNVIRVLILEDDLETLSKLLTMLSNLENNQGMSISATVLSEYWQVEDYLNTSSREKFNIVLLDRDCKIGGSFHSLDFNKFGQAKIIGISSVPQYNQELIKKRVYAVVDKDYKRLGEFVSSVSGILEKIIVSP